MTYTDGLLQRLRSLSRCEHSDLSIGDEAADEIERLRAEVAEQRRERFRDFSYLTASESQARAECEEQARLNGMGSEREAALMSRATRA